MSGKGDAGIGSAATTGTSTAFAAAVATTDFAEALFFVMMVAPQTTPTSSANKTLRV